MDNLKMIVTNFHDTAYVTATSEAMPAAFTQRSNRARAWRSTDTSTQTITSTLPSPKFVDGVVLYRHNLSDDATARLELLVSGEVVYDSGEVSAADRTPLGEFTFGVDAWGASISGTLPIQQIPFWTPKVVCDEYRITITDPDNNDGYIEVGRVIAGEAVSPRVNASYGLQLEWQDMGEHRRTEGMSLRTVGEGLSRRLPINLAFLDPYDRRVITKELLKNGKHSDVYISVFPGAGGMDEGEYAFLARRESNHIHTHDFYANWQSEIVFVEV